MINDPTKKVVLSRLGELLVDQRLITREQLDEGLRYQESHGGRIGSCLVKLGYVSEEDMTRILSRQYGVPPINLSSCTVEPEVTRLIPHDVAIRYQVVPLSRAGSTLSIAMIDPSNVLGMSQ